MTKLKCSPRRSALIAAVVAVLLFTMAGSGLATPGDTALVSVASSGEQGNLDSHHASISDDGRFVAFASAADNLVEGDTNAACDVFVRDLQVGTTERVSVHDSGEQANGDSWQPSISADGRYVTFHHGPVDLAGNDPNERYDVYVRDLQAGTTERVSIDSSGSPINGSSGNASISADG